MAKITKLFLCNIFVQIPKDVSWAAFIKMCNAIDVSALLRTLDPVKIHKVGVGAASTASSTVPVLNRVTQIVSLTCVHFCEWF